MIKVGFIGLGIMGRPMAGHLCGAGHELSVFDHTPAPAALIGQGARQCQSSRAVAEQAEINQSGSGLRFLPGPPVIQRVTLYRYD